VQGGGHVPGLRNDSALALRHTRDVMPRRHTSHTPSGSEDGRLGIPPLSTGHGQALLGCFAYAALEYKMLLPHRRDTEQERLKERNLEGEDHLLAGLGRSLPKTLKTVLCFSVRVAIHLLQLEAK